MMFRIGSICAEFVTLGLIVFRLFSFVFGLLIGWVGVDFGGISGLFE